MRLSVEGDIPVEKFEFVKDHIKSVLWQLYHVGVVVKRID